MFNGTVSTVLEAAADQGLRSYDITEPTLNETITQAQWDALYVRLDTAGFVVSNLPDTPGLRVSW